MSKQERAAWLSLFIEMIVAIYYFSSVFTMGPDTPLYSPAMAGLVGKVIVLAIILGIIGGIAMRILVPKASDTVAADERDTAIAAKAYRNGYFVLGVGAGLVIACIVTAQTPTLWGVDKLVSPLSPVVIAQLLLLVLMLGGLAANASRVFFYRRGY